MCTIGKQKQQSPSANQNNNKIDLHSKVTKRNNKNNNHPAASHQQ